MDKNNGIYFRIGKEKKEDWKKKCNQQKISLTSLIIDSVENRLLDDERRKVLAFIEKQDNIFVKIENNINQFAKIANSQKQISQKHLEKFNLLVNDIKKLKQHQNEIFIKIYSMLGG